MTGSIVRMRAGNLVACSLLAVLATGCGSSESTQKKCYPVTGQLFVSAKPAAGATLFFQPQDGSKPADWTSGYPRATVQADGSFEVETYAAADGAPAGEYIVLARWPLSTAGENEEAGNQDQLGGKYLQAESSPLKATVHEKATTLSRFDLP